jgi:hypothetical protein
MLDVRVEAGLMVIRMFVLFARGAKFPANFHPTSNFLLHSSPFHTDNMAGEMGSVITIDNFSTKMSPFDPNRTENHLYGLVDMGRYSPMPAFSRTSHSNAPK